MAGDRVVWGAGTARTLRAHWMLHELELPYETRPIGSRTGETQTAAFTRLNPRQKIPVLEDDGLVLAESAAIVRYLADRYGQARGLAPAPGARERARYDEWCFFVMTELDAHSLYVLRRHGELAELYGEAPNALSAAREYFLKQVAVASGELARHGPCLLGEGFGAADILLGTCLLWAEHCELPLDDTLAAYRKRLTARDAFRRAAAVNFPAPA